ncbi:uncharacterized protein LOC129796853 [Lutzomyia longipalpis]|uniref:uncharacterized protein LOC129796853 n=1 Tax=Lutzomyia longipalpis TaxID=7200 RepID=UPI0024843B18|nr:uncharacterized protein LOC129796853 [Lutzomyia longipalpis]
MCLKNIHLKPFLIILIACLLCVAIVSSSSCLNCTENTFKFTEIISRKRRYLVFPPGSTILCTLSVVKAFMFTSPRGHNMVMEVDFYYPLPDKVIHHRKENPKPVETTTQKPIVASPPVELLDFHHDDDLHNFPHYHDEVLTSHRKNDLGVYLSKYNYPKFNKKYFNQKINQKNYINPLYKSKFRNKMRKRRDEMKESLDVIGNHEHKGHRDRRDFYRSIEKFIDENDVGLDGRSCVLRTICEVQLWLMPKGVSLFHDIIRLLFSLPSNSHHIDHYKEAMSSDEYNNCQVYEKKCPISILSFILYSEKKI